MKKTPFKELEKDHKRLVVHRVKRVFETSMNREAQVAVNLMALMYSFLGHADKVEISGDIMQGFVAHTAILYASMFMKQADNGKDVIVELNKVFDEENVLIENWPHDLFPIVEELIFEFDK